MPVGNSLRAGSPDEDYTVDNANFIKSWQRILMRAVHQAYLGVWMIDTQNDRRHKRHWFMRFVCLHFDCQASPYIANQAQARIMDHAMGHHLEQGSEFTWNKVVLNLLTMSNGDPSLQQVLLLQKDNELSSQQVRHIEDIHHTARGQTDQEAWAACKQLCSLMNCVGKLPNA